MEKQILKLDDYIVLKLLGKGATSEVYLVQGIDGYYYAAKVMRTSKYSEKQFSNMQNEFKCLKQLQHSNIVQWVFVNFQGSLTNYEGEKSFESEPVMYIILEYCFRNTLFDYLFQSAFTDQAARFYFLQLINAVAYMHQQNVFHRDLKLDNLLVDFDYNVKIADFGYAKIHLQTESQLTTYCGTKQYMAPEILSFNKGISISYQGCQVDVFSIGVILFIMKSGNPPFMKANSEDK